MENQNYNNMPDVTAIELYRQLQAQCKLPDNPKESRFYDHNLEREFCNWLKQINEDGGYLPNDDEAGFLQEIECAIILRNLANVKVERYEERDHIICILEQRIQIRDTALLPDDYSRIDGRLPLDVVPNDEAQRIYSLINPDGHKDFRLIPLPTRNYIEYMRVPSGTKVDGSKDKAQPEPPMPAAATSIIAQVQTQEERDKISDLEFLAQFELDPTILDEPIQYCFEIGGVGFSPRGDIQALKGAQKNGKSFFLCLLMGAAMRGEYLGVKCMIKAPKILYCDTEQHPRNTRLIYRRVCQIAGIDGHVRHDRINMQHLRLADDVETIKKAIRLKMEYYHPDIVLIDGLVDCLVDFNDQIESKQVITEFSRLALEHNCCIWSVLHTNPDSDKMRGHAGSFLAQKASDVILCLKDKKEDGTTLFEIAQTENRNNQDFNKFSFAIECRKDERGEFIAVPCKAYVSIQEKAALDELFRWALNDYPLRRADLKDKICSDDSPKKVSRSTAYKLINDALEAGLIKDDDQVTYRLRYAGLDMPNDEGMPF